MLDRKNIIQEATRFVQTSLLKERNDANSVASLRLQSLLNRLEPGNILEDKLRVCAQGLKNIQPLVDPYLVLGVDGSQIYPDRSFLWGKLGVLNVGGIVLTYGSTRSSAEMFSYSSLVSPEDLDESLIFCPEIFDILRGQFELECAFEKSMVLKDEHQGPFCVVLDGAMIPYGLMLKNVRVQQYFVHKFSQVLQKFRAAHIPLVWYISAPQSRVLSKIIGALEVQDASLLNFLEFGQSTPFFSEVKLELFGVEIDAQDAPIFTYLKTMDEVVRVEFPAWMLNDIPNILSILQDQAQKGMGYPVALTEAHRQALISEVDRQFILRLLEQQSSERLDVSFKALRKRVIPV